jgi:hypothetical protein
MSRINVLTLFLATSYNAIIEKTKSNDDTVKYITEILNSIFDNPLSSKVMNSDSVKSFIDNSNYSLNYNVSVSNSNILISAEYTLKKPVYDASLYPGLKYFYENVIKYLNQPIEIQL